LDFSRCILKRERRNKFPARMEKEKRGHSTILDSPYGKR
jgi:hypothetical protein